MKGNNKQTATFPQQKEPPRNTAEDKYENATEANSDDDFQPNITIKRKNREPTPVNSSQKRMKKGKEKSSSSTSTAIVESKPSDDAPLAKSTVATTKSAKYTPIALVNAQQIALYECTKIQTAYLNNIKAHFGSRLRAILNKLCKPKELAADLRKDLKQKNVDKRAVNKALREGVYGPCNQVKRAIEKKEIPDATILDTSARKKVKAILQSCPNNYKLKKDSTFYDIKSNPECHYKAFMKISELFDSEGLRQFSCFPVRTISIPCYMTLDFKSIHYNVLKNKTALKMDNKFQTWGSVVNTNNKAFKD
ncbi:hypothetical protein BCV72DRAFT_338324 [Rhizopus microsporus var. microsporus]|uniref:Uncharacterized protein n=2 Tax=Rhizopus microsporus TaxID=58291 RepID=A0A2G4T9A8_RHIZD|nr:uncharacterized protein RHIMIDRAFT_288210 [Rhizopus microsporus ATCC 52813]ORE02998.1 hypothetical protein BCV72DRAFT_338324 [Rhizopus microsporus var. microsporus]PHZ17286.1 hypothetical protein RHIMIDRAFT_288210 [Rhizopus microsporus ATCC 52813]